MKTLPRPHPLKLSPLHKLGNHRRLAALLKTDVRSLKAMAALGERGYTEWDDVSAKGKTRHIENPKPQLKRVQARLATLLALIEPPEFLTCPVKGRSYVTNARHHVGAAEIVTMDVSAYFQSTTWKRVFWFFSKRLCMPSDTAWTLAHLATLNGQLPTGSPLSPVMAYLAHEDMWLNVANLAAGSGCRVTVYMDDLTISGDRVPESLLWAIKQEIHKTGLRLNNKKERRYMRGEGVVTGVVVTPNGLRLPKRSHLNLSEARKAFAATAEVEQKTKIGHRVRGIESQHRQVLKS
ncbi:MAG: reverse transcriptase family protein [Brevundimonas sp.]|uniref:reverse transcriptase family protein n=1 Tax=Brevundimonas sp. TaxID=1871086 RepID=UPI00391A7699